jgi:hypothetical protein
MEVICSDPALALEATPTTIIPLVAVVFPDQAFAQAVLLFIITRPVAVAIFLDQVFVVVIQHPTTSIMAVDMELPPEFVTV